MSMTEHQKDQILKVVSYYMKHELRERIMREAPVAYNAWVEGDVVDVVYKSDGAYVNTGYIPIVPKNYTPKDPPENP